MRKYKLISALAEETAKEVVRNEESWRRYLNTASRLYKYPFKEQLLIYAQRPDATACASIEIWNEKINPITEGKTGTFATYLPGVESYLAEKQAMQKASALEATLCNRYLNGCRVWRISQSGRVP